MRFSQPAGQPTKCLNVKLMSVTVTGAACASVMSDCAASYVLLLVW